MRDLLQQGQAACRTAAIGGRKHHLHPSAAQQQLVCSAQLACLY
jgi:hypothetical protein